MPSREAARGRWTAAAALAALALFRLPVLLRYPPWTDEAWSMELIRPNLVRMLRLHADDQTHPPLFYFGLWLWQRIGGDSLLWLRALPCLFGILLALPVLAICRRAALSREATVLALLFVATSNWLVYYSDELRNYSPYAFFAAWSLGQWMTARRDDAPRGAVRRLTLVNALLVYTHYFGLLVLAAEWMDALLFARRRLKAITLSLLASIASLAPWLWFVWRRAGLTGDGALGTVAWIPRPRLADWLDPFLAAIGQSPWLAVDLVIVVAAGAAIAVYFVRQRPSHTEALRPVLLAAIVPPLVAMTASLVLQRSAWVPRYLLASAVPFLVLLAASLTSARAVRWRRAAWLLALWPAAVTVTALLRGNEKVRFDELARAIAARTPATDTVWAFNFVQAAPLQWQASHGRQPINVRYAASAAAITAERGWVVWSERHPPAGLPPTATLLRRGYTIGVPEARSGMWDDALGVTDSVVAAPFSRRVR